MYYSALVRQDFHAIARRYGVEVALDMFTDLFRRQREGEDIKLSRALERNFDQASTPIEQQIKADIDAYQAQQVSKWEKDQCVEKKRLADVERTLQVKETKKAREDVRITTNKIQNYLERLSDVRRTEPKEDYSRIFAMTYAPVIAKIDGRLQIVPMRYTCRLAGKPANYDVRYPGTHNAFGAFLTVSSVQTTPIQGSGEHAPAANDRLRAASGLWPLKVFGL